MRRSALALVLAGSLICCGDRATAPAANPSTPASPSVAAQAEAAPAPQPSPVKRQEKPLPAFEGTTLDGAHLAISSLIGKRVLLFFFNPEVPEAGVSAQAVTAIQGLRAANNFEIVGIGIGSTREALERFRREQKLDFPILDDSSGTISERLQLQAPVLLVGVDADGYVVSVAGGFPTSGPEPSRAVEVTLRDSLRLPPIGSSATPTLGVKPRAPEWSAQRLGGGTLRSSELRGRPLILMFFLHTCPHCHHALEFLKGYLPTLPEATRPALVGVSVSDRETVVGQTLKDDGLDFFPVVFDPDYTMRDAFGVYAGVPDIFLIDAGGRVVARVQGWRDDRDPPLMKMRLAKLAGQQVPMLLHQTGYSGNEFCTVCHEQEGETWLLTNHAGAFDTLVKHGASVDPECVSCHVVGFGKPGGYTISPPTPSLENVGCEDCHGRGGPHLSPSFVQAGNYQPVCQTCHDPKHSLGFQYAEFLPRISHKANAQLASLSLEEKRKILAARHAPRADLLPQNAAFVGSEACKGCHAAEYATWSKQPHAHALASLEKQGKAGENDCLKCHTTGFGRTGGFPVGAKPAAHEDLARVGCESCHGPGGEHVKEGAPKTGNIVSLGDKCDSCVILQICGTCHDHANDPDFEFNVKKKIEAQRHGTIEPGTGKPKAKSAASLPASPTALLGPLEHAFALAEDRG